MDVARGVTSEDWPHATTRLAAAALATRARGRVLDVGTGDGVLARAALAAGAVAVVGIDRAPVPTVAGAEMRQVAIEDFHGAFDLVVANLPEDVLLRMVPRLLGMAPEAILTGVRLPRVSALRARIRAAGGRTGELGALDGWGLVIAHR
jgi:ribosomal protein L11 methyltransferase